MSQYDGMSIAAIINDFIRLRGGLSEQRTRDQLVGIIEERLTDARREGVSELQDHLQRHLTDGAWHDRCAYCRERRVHGGTGVVLLDNSRRKDAS